MNLQMSNGFMNKSKVTEEENKKEEDNCLSEMNLIS